MRVSTPLSKENHGAIWALHLEGHTADVIANKTGLNRRTISDNIKKMRDTGSMASRPRSGRPRKTTVGEDLEVFRDSRRSPFAPARIHKNMLFRQHGTMVSTKTINRRLKERGLVIKPAKKVPLLTAVHKAARMAFAHEHKDWTVAQWQRVIWTDESRFALNGSDRTRKLVRLLPGEERMDPFTIKIVKHGGGGLMVWGCFSVDGVGTLHRIDGIMDRYVYLDILKTVGIPSALALRGSDFIWQQDNDPKHTANIVKEFFRSPDEELCFPPIEQLRWPAQSPDLNPIENLWAIVDQKLRSKQLQRWTLNQMFDALQESWSSLTQELLQNLVSSMPRRMKSVILARGGTINY